MGRKLTFFFTKAHRLRFFLKLQFLQSCHSMSIVSSHLRFLEFFFIYFLISLADVIYLGYQHEANVKLLNFEISVN